MQILFSIVSLMLVCPVPFLKLLTFSYLTEKRLAKVVKTCFPK